MDLTAIPAFQPGVTASVFVPFKKRLWTDKKMLRVMKLIFILLTAACLHVSAEGYSQRISLNEKNAALTDVFKSIRQQTGYLFVYDLDMVKQARKVTVRLDNATLEEVLKICFEKQPFTYTIIDKTIVIKKKEIAVRPNGQASLANEPPPVDVKGRIVNEKGEPIAGASVLVKGSQTKGTTTNADGEFILRGIDDTSTLVISGVDIERFEVNVNGRNELALRAKLKITQEDEVIINTGYQQVRKERATGSFSQPQDEIFKARITPDVLSRLNTITSGVVFNTNASNGAVEIGIRSRSTIFANAEPLVVIDNFPFSGSLSDLNLNPNDVENISILKDAAAASIWGVRASNGVIVITTKKGKLRQPLQVSFHTNLTIGARPDLNYNPAYINSTAFIDLEKYLFDKGFYDPSITANNFSLVSPVVEILNQRKQGLISPADSASRIADLLTTDARDQQANYFYQKAIRQQYALNLNGGGEKTNYFFSIGYDKTRENQIGSTARRYTVSNLTTFKPFRKLELSAGIYFIKAERASDNVHSLLTSSANSLLPYTKYADALGNPLPTLRNYRASFVDSAQRRGFLNWQLYPITEIGQNTSDTKSDDIRLLLGANYSILKGLNADIKFQYRRINSINEQLATEQSFYVRDLVNSMATVTNGSVTSLYTIPKGGVLTTTNSFATDYNARGQLNYDKQWGQHSVSALAGTEIWETKVEGNGLRLYGYDVNTTSFTQPAITGAAAYPTGQFLTVPVTSLGITSLTLDRYRSYFGNAAYTYDQRYTVSVSGRKDGSNIFGIKSNQKVVPLWSTGFKWNIDKERFFKANWISMLTLRASYGYNGNVDKNVTAFTTALYSTNALYTGYQYGTIQQAPNPELRWEKNRVINLGLDFRLKNNWLYGTIEYYTKKGTDLMGDIELPSSAGFTNPSTNSNTYRGNFSAMKGRGVDIELNSPVLNRKFKWNTGLLFSFAKDEVTKYDVAITPKTLVLNSTTGIGFYPVVGRPVFGIYSFRWAGLDPATGDPQGYDPGKNVSKDYTALTNSKSMEEIVYSGPSRPVVFGGFNNRFAYKNLSLFINLGYKFGYYFRRTSIRYSALFTNWSAHKDYTKRWLNPGDEVVTNVPSLVYPANANRDLFYTFSETLIEKGDHIRLQDIGLGYTITHTSGKFPFNSLQVNVYANNLGILWRANKQGLDPDVIQASFPNPKTLAVGIKANF